MTTITNLLTNFTDVLALPYETLTDSNKLPNTAGVYFVVARQKVFYVGRSVNLRRRLRTHHRLMQFERLNPSIHFLEAPVESLDCIEREAIQTFRPLLNYVWLDANSRRDGEDIVWEPDIITFIAELESKVSHLQQENLELKELLTQLIGQMQQIVSVIK